MNINNFLIVDGESGTVIPAASAILLDPSKLPVSAERFTEHSDSEIVALARAHGKDLDALEYALIMRDMGPS